MEGKKMNVRREERNDENGEVKLKHDRRDINARRVTLSFVRV